MRISQNLMVEIKRKSFHCLGLIFPAIYYFSDKSFIVGLLFILTILIIYIDNMRHTNTQLQIIIKKIFFAIMRDHEKLPATLTGASYFVTGLFISALIFPKAVAINSWLVLILADSAAALTGKAIGTAFVGNKSIAGSVAFFVVTVMLSLTNLSFLAYPTKISVIFITAIVTTYAELYAEKLYLNDNLIIPILFGSVFMLTNFTMN